ncbi:MAG: stage III sporulation protein AC [Ruminococcaceae bacterium]|nr:stage III sporulation protein AC [Oscillospiraceae bacterium]
MDIATLLKVVGIGFLVSVAYQILSRSGREEQAMLVSIGGIIVVLLMLMGGLSQLVENLRELFGI